MTHLETVALYKAANSDVNIEVWLDYFKRSSEIRLTDTRVQEGLQALQTAGLIAAHRKEEVLKIEMV